MTDVTQQTLAIVCNCGNDAYLLIREPLTPKGVIVAPLKHIELKVCLKCKDTKLKVPDFIGVEELTSSMDSVQETLERVWGNIDAELAKEELENR